MFTTNSNQMLNFSVSDSTVYVSPGCAVVGNYVMDFRGDSITFDNMVSSDFTNNPNYFQYSVLSLYNYNGFADVTAITASSVSSEAALISPTIFDTTNTGSNDPADATTTTHTHGLSRDVRPVGLFLFTNDGTNVIHKSSSRII